MNEYALDTAGYAHDITGASLDLAVKQNGYSFDTADASLKVVAEQVFLSIQP